MYSIEPIGIIETPYKEKFAVPRQPRLVPAAKARVKLLGEANNPEAVRGLEQFSHVWLLFLFDQNLEAGWKPTVRPPRLGGNERIGVFASRSTFRPNGIGMSAVEVKGITKKGDQIYIDLGSVDLVDGTPIVDIKPYIPYSDAIPEAIGGYAGEEPEKSNVTFSSQALAMLTKRSDTQYVQSVIEQVLAQDPRPAYKKNKPDTKEYAVNLFDLNVKFSVNSNLITVTAIESF
ncbi:tRNA (N6-threonylcarbamoyladenosine(37)-N6)-methyltransferase TrmO [Vibrio parahaemolyticus]|uniref:tRNA (N6-threonylcarbamoyladenosine(37)-N6)-methyltransferase TrmO n=1 Tax=Vibrio parahaemolyticus TaxID=670 RepID=UPI0004D64B14|nr:tRNA (N6-threonylcarbamoyladenosine(37)-N6)-methyltransferase TrmO [Vibrio parahaemolyticus]EGQ7875108.1 tRNA (N6-threonylcarbamoyladenosine(37)-N6)-methyltransferase TrmO [Vibrio parahaemolyticus]EGR0226173.1 tRNA (N6-threonylcarbamoyladenosine(37)-N6)-methyltransferase TrmO [Vibrio parahaemolyticus]EGR1360788.1 tRNA (N6-threonylcarbamoyladenosine(37)-N6)-methyltransferase TrmO [Vibrio parahaemolyticus]EGR9058077.1 tRNA (N6-threonylcarbamoyladenosine(37)-N6)-methyltransferase TrmO [Vibrio p